MIDNIEKVFFLEQILETVDLEMLGNTSLDKIVKKFSNDNFDIDYVQLEILRKRIGDIGENYVYEREKVSDGTLWEVHTAL